MCRQPGYSPSPRPDRQAASLPLSFLGLGSHFDDFACLFSPPLLTPDTTHYHHRHHCRAAEAEAEAEAPALSSSLSARKTGEKEEEELGKAAAPATSKRSKLL